MEFCVAWHKNRNRFLHKIGFRMRKWYSGTVVIPSRFIFNYIWHLKILWHHQSETFIGFVNYSIYIFLCFWKRWSALLISPPPPLAKSQLNNINNNANVFCCPFLTSERSNQSKCLFLPQSVSIAWTQALVFFCYYDHYLTGLFACLFSWIANQRPACSTLLITKIIENHFN